MIMLWWRHDYSILAYSKKYFELNVRGLVIVPIIKLPVALSIKVIFYINGNPDQTFLLSFSKISVSIFCIKLQYVDLYYRPTL